MVRSRSQAISEMKFFTITGKHNLRTIIVTCYFPCKEASTGSVYSQHLLYMAENKTAYPDHINCLRQLFGYDLRQLLESLTVHGYQLIVCGNYNSECSELAGWMLDLALTDMIAERHGPGPKTYNQSKDKPIDCFL